MIWGGPISRTTRGAEAKPHGHERQEPRPRLEPEPQLEPQLEQESQ